MECTICCGPSQGKKEANLDLCNECHPLVVADFDVMKERASKMQTGAAPLLKLTREALVHTIAKGMTHRAVGDVYALDVHGKPRWTWYLEDAERYVDAYAYELFPKQPT